MAPRFNDEEGLAALMDKAIREHNLVGTMPPEVLQFPSEENHQTAIVRVCLIVSGQEGVGHRTYWALGDANPENTTSQDVKRRPVAMAESRGWVRALRILTNVYEDRVDARPQQREPQREQQRTTQTQASAAPGMTKDQWDAMIVIGARLGLDPAGVTASVKELIGVRAKDATAQQAATALAALQQRLDALTEAPLPDDEGPPAEADDPETRDQLRREINKMLPKLASPGVGSTLQAPGARATVTEMRAFLDKANRALAS